MAGKKVSALVAVLSLGALVLAGCAPPEVEEEILTGEGWGYSEDVPIQVEVTQLDGEITDIQVLEHDESEDLGEPALDDLIGLIIEEQSVEVEAVSGATYTSEGFMEAVAEAVGQ